MKTRLLTTASFLLLVASLFPACSLPRALILKSLVDSHGPLPPSSHARRTSTNIRPWAAFQTPNASTSIVTDMPPLEVYAYYAQLFKSKGFVPTGGAYKYPTTPPPQSTQDLQNHGFYFENDPPKNSWQLAFPIFRETIFLRITPDQQGSTISLNVTLHSVLDYPAFLAATPATILGEWALFLQPVLGAL